MGGKGDVGMRGWWRGGKPGSENFGFGFSSGLLPRKVSCAVSSGRTNLGSENSVLGYENSGLGPDRAELVSPFYARGHISDLSIVRSDVWAGQVLDPRLQAPGSESTALGSEGA